MTNIVVPLRNSLRLVGSVCPVLLSINESVIVLCDDRFRELNKSVIPVNYNLAQAKQEVSS